MNQKQVIRNQQQSCNLALNNELTERRRILHEKLTGSQLIKKFSAFYGTRRFNTAFTAPITSPNLEPDQSIPRPQSHFLKIHFNIILPSTPRSLSLSSPPPKPCLLLSHLPYVPHSPPISCNLVRDELNIQLERRFGKLPVA